MKLVYKKVEAAIRMEAIPSNIPIWTLLVNQTYLQQYFSLHSYITDCSVITSNVNRLYVILSFLPNERSWINIPRG